MAICVGVGVSAVASGALNRSARCGLPAEVFAIYFVLALLYVGATRFGARELLRMGQLGASRRDLRRRCRGRAVVLVVVTSRQFRPVALVDDNPKLAGRARARIQVSPRTSCPTCVESTALSWCCWRMPSAIAPPARRNHRVADAQGFKVQTVPDIGEIVSGKARLEEVRDIDVHDLLGRDPVPPNPALLGACMRGKSILVTGAGGSIGSELCRQIMELAPRRLVLLEVSELALYEIERELRSLNVRLGNRIELVALLGNAHHKQRVREIITTFAIQTVYHAAAYKHVPIVEHNMIEGIHNNIFATYNTAEAAMECRVETFVLISTDKAVNPTNVMGCTKRVAEMVLQGLQQRGA